MKKWSCILLSLALTLACCAAFAEETDGDSLTRLGLEAGDAGDYAKTREYWEQAAEKGSARAVADLGYLYENGYGVEKDEAKAMEYYRRAADLGFAGALTEMAYMYSYGLGVEQDYEKAWEYLVKAVDDESTAADACFMLGQLYMGGAGVEQNDEKAADFFLKAIELGSAEARESFDGLVKDGKIPEDYTAKEIDLSGK